MKINLTKGIQGYLFLLVLAGFCLYTAAVTFKTSLPAGIFAAVLGVGVLAVGVTLSLRKD
jgi:hypothetical protein